MQIIQRLRLVFALLALLFASAEAHTADWSLKITRIEVGGVEVKTIASLQVTPPRSAQTETLRDVKVGKTFLEGSTLAAPARTHIVLRSSNDNEIRLSPGSRIKISAGSQMGEEYEQETGESFFNVKRALNFFNVRHRHFQALVKGTRYSVKVDPQKEITFAVEEGTVKTAREGKIKFEDGNREGSITEAELLKAGDTKTYRLDLDNYLKTFKHFGEAEAYYRKNLEADRKSGDPDRIEMGLNQLGIALLRLSQYQAAIPYFQDFLESSRKRNPSGLHNDIAGAEGNIGLAYWKLGGTENIQRAITYYGEALKIHRQLFPSGVHIDIARDLGNLGGAYWSLGGTVNIQRAIGYLEEALKINRQLYPNGVHNDIARDLGNLGLLYRDLGGALNNQRAIGYQEEALKINRQLYPGGVHDDIASNLGNLGLLYRDLGGAENIQRAIGYHEEALKIRRQLYPNGMHNDIAGNLDNLGAAYWSLGGIGNIQRAIGYQEEALKIRRQLYPNGMHNDIAGNLGNLGAAYWSLGGTENLQRAIGYHEEALKIHRQLFPSGVHNDIARDLGNLGVAYSRLGGTGNIQRSISYQEEALKVRRQLFPDGVHIDIARDLANLGVAYHNLGGTENIQRSIGYQEELVKIRRQLFPNGHPDLANTLGSLAFNRLFVGQQKQALRDVREALQMAPNILWLRSNEAHALLLLGQEAEALEIYKQYGTQRVNAKLSFRDAVLEDFVALRRAGVDHPGMRRVEALYSGAGFTK